MPEYCGMLQYGDPDEVQGAGSDVPPEAGRSGGTPEPKQEPDAAEARDQPQVPPQASGSNRLSTTERRANGSGSAEATLPNRLLSTDAGDEGLVLAVADQQDAAAPSSSLAERRGKQAPTVFVSSQESKHLASKPAEVAPSTEGRMQREMYRPDPAGVGLGSASSGNRDMSHGSDSEMRVEEMSEMGEPMHRLAAAGEAHYSAREIPEALRSNTDEKRPTF